MSELTKLKNETLAQRVRRLRTALGWTLPQLAEYSMLPYGTVFKVERGDRCDPRISTVTALARAFRLDPGRFLDGLEW